MYRCKTAVGSVLDVDTAACLFTLLSNEVKWDDGIRSKNGFTRKAKMIGPQDSLFEELFPIVQVALKKLSVKDNFAVLGIYLNYLEDGNMYVPNHSHKGTQQLVISLGAPRTLIIGKTRHRLESGDGAIFGSAIHGVPKEPELKEGRISIATFMKRI